MYVSGVVGVVLMYSCSMSVLYSCTHVAQVLYSCTRVCCTHVQQV
jgi:hypothetical protein